MKKVFISLIAIICSFTLILNNGVSIAALETEDEVVNVNYDVKSEFRAAWVSALVNDISKFTSETQYKNAITNILNNMESLNLNVMIFHVRIMNDAFYKSSYNKWSTYYNTNPSWEALPWIIEECHNRGIEFHAWMNPYRVSTTNFNLESLAKNYNSSNPASDPANLLAGDDVVILNPGIPRVRNFLINTCMEVVNNYDVDAIHFDDYFYAEGIEDSATYSEYSSGQGIEQFRRDSVDDFIRRLSASIKNYNEENNKSVQLGISPTAVWECGDGVVTYDEDGKAITNGSATSKAQSHYGDYLYCDTLKWVNEEWIDYILPQCYIGVSNNNELFYRIVEWWAKVVAQKPCKFYVGIGLYRASSNYDWSSATELKTEFDFMATLDNVDGFSVFAYKSLFSSNSNMKANVTNAASYFEDKVLAPVVSQYEDYEKLSAVNNSYIINNDDKHQIYFDLDKDVRYYCLLKEVDETISLLDIFNTNDLGYGYYEDTCSDDVNYYLAKVNCNNEIGEYIKLSSSDKYEVINYLGKDGEVLTTTIYKNDEERVFPTVPNYEGYEFQEWEKIDENTYQIKCQIKQLVVSYYLNNELYQELKVNYGEDALDIEVSETGYNFNGWNDLPTNIKENTNVYGELSKQKFTISYYDGDTLISTSQYEYLDEIEIDKEYEKKGYNFLGWLMEEQLLTDKIVITSDINLYASLQVIPKQYKITYALAGGQCDNLITTFYDYEEVILPTPTKEGCTFVGWYENNIKIEVIEDRNYNLLARWEENIEVEEDDGCMNSINTLFTAFALLGLCFLRRSK